MFIFTVKINPQFWSDEFYITFCYGIGHMFYSLIPITKNKLVNFVIHIL